jgi:hypothetical protein
LRPHPPLIAALARPDAITKMIQFAAFEEVDIGDHSAGAPPAARLIPALSASTKLGTVCQTDWRSLRASCCLAGGGDVPMAFWT